MKTEKTVHDLLQAWINELSVMDANEPVTKYELYQMLQMLQQEMMTPLPEPPKE